MLKVSYKSDKAIEVGVDEAGRGCLWGPMYAGAVVWPPEDDWTDEYREISPMIKDSKKLSEKKRMYMTSAIKSLAVTYGIGSVSAQEIDQEGMSFTNRLAFQRAIQACSITPDRILIDGILSLLPEQLITLGVEESESYTIVDGDAQYIPIAAASILAKTAHDSWVSEALQRNPILDERYNLSSSKGYGTEKHRKGLLEFGADQEHRRLFLRKLFNQTPKCLIEDD